MTVLVGGQIAALLVVIATAYAAGQWFTRDFAIAAALGLGLLGTAFFLLGLASALRPEVVISIVAAVNLIALRRWQRPHVHRLTWIVAIAIGVPFILSLYPPVAYDETLYHLPFARLFERAHAVVFADTLRFPVFPQLADTLFAGIMMFASDVRTHVVELAAVIVTAIAIATAVPRTSSATGWLAAAFWIGNPIVAYYGGSSLVDLTLTMFCTTAWIAWMRWDAEGRLRWLVIAGMATGFAAATKYTGLYFVGALAVATLFGRLLVVGSRLPAEAKRRQPATGNWKPVLLFTAVAMAAAAPMYLRNLAVTGNPVFPFLNAWFGHGLPLAYSDRSAAGTLASPWLFVETPLRFVADRQFLHGEPPLSPVLFLMLPFAILAIWRDRSLRPIAAVMLLYAYLVTTRDVRFMLPVVPFVSFAAATGVVPLLERFTRHALITAAVPLIATGPAFLYGALKIVQRGAVPVTRDQRDAFLESRVRAYRALTYLNDRYGSAYTVYAVADPNSRYFANGRYLGDVMGPYRFSLLRRERTPQQLRDRLKSMGATFFLFDRAAASERSLHIANPDAAMRSLGRYGVVELYALSGE